ncbi:tetratricopeptide repeat protein [Chryseolinea sp. T2]|uniref:tetratricopeptide repeat protein n=1 Tax=Chryseolinea sp. T2 TaxID=3129255 RepID=UPI003077FACF
MKAIFCLLMFISAGLFAQTTKVDSLQHLLASAPNVEVRIDLLTSLSLSYSTLSLTKSEQLAQEALTLAQPIGYGKGIASSYNALGICSSIRGDYSKGLDYFMQSLRLRESLGDQSAIASTHSNIARIYTYQHDYDHALEYALKSMDAKRKINSTKQLGLGYINIGGIYMNKKNYALALTMFSTAHDLFEDRKMTVEQGWALVEIAKVYDALENYPEALNMALRAKGKLDLKGDVFTAGEVFRLIGAVYHHMGNRIEASRYLRTAIAMSDDNEDSNGRIMARRQLADTYKDAGMLDSALYYQEQCLVLNAEIFNTEKARQMATLEKVYQTESKDRELREKNDKLRFQATVISIISVLMLVLAVLGYISYHYYRDKRKTAKELEKLNDEISNKHVEILVQTEELEKANEEVRRINESLEQEVQHRSERIRQQNQMLIEYAYFNAHNVRGPLARILGLAGLMESEHSVELVKEYNVRIHQSALELDKVVREINNKLQYEH